MRIMLAVFPATAHLLPLVSYAWALQSAGHDVVVAAPPGYDSGVAVPGFAKAVNAAGLTAVTCGEPEPLAIHDRAYPGFADLLPNREEAERYVRALGIDDPTERAVWDVFYHFAMLTIRNYHPPEPRQDIEALIDFARSWQPDLVLWEFWFPAGAIAARVTGAAHARVLMSPDYNAWAYERMVKHAGAPDAPPNLLAEAMRPLAEHHGLEVDDELLLGQWTVDPCLPGMRLPTSVPTVPVRYVPYTGASVRPRWLQDEPARPRVAVTLGVSVRTFVKGDRGRLAKLMEAVDGLDIEVVATLSDSQLLDVPNGVPDNVRVIEYVPLDQLLPTCAAIVNHGSWGTFLTASAKGVPQLICDTDEPARVYAKATADGIEWEFSSQKQSYAAFTSAYVTERGAGARLNHQTQSAEEIRAQLRQVVEDPSFQRNANAICTDWQALPSPIEIVPTLEKLTDQHRGR